MLCIIVVTRCATDEVLGPPISDDFPTSSTRLQEGYLIMAATDPEKQGNISDRDLARQNQEQQETRENWKLHRQTQSSGGRK
jgi:hypothetical protein